MAYRDLEKRRAVTRERVRRWREKKREFGTKTDGKATVTPSSEVVTPVCNARTIEQVKLPGLSEVTPEDIENLPMSMKAQLAAEDRARRVMKMPDKLRERGEAAVRRFRGY